MVARRNRPYVNRHKLLRTLADQATKVRETRQWGDAYELKELLSIVRSASPRKRFVTYQGIRFPLGGGLVIRCAFCPDSGRALVGLV